jgi:Glyoxalase-like domain
MISRREFLVISGAGLVASRSAFTAEEQVPRMLDHLLLGCNDLNRAVSFVEEHTSVRAATGGVHPGRGTRNALLSLGERRYLEIISIDPAQEKVPDFAMPLVNMLKSLTTPRLVGWAAHPADIEALTKKLKASGIEFDGPRPGSRARPDGRLLKWKTVNLIDDHSGVLPFFIEWDSGSPHPSTDAPAGCRLEQFVIADPDPVSLQKQCDFLGLDVNIVRGEASGLRARIASAKGSLDLTTS